MFRLTGALMLMASSASANCGYGQETFLSCVIGSNGKSLTVCVSGDRVNYRYGRSYGNPELTLSAYARDIDYLPWPGIGRWVNEEVKFTNGSYSYVVHGGFDRFAADRPADGMEGSGGVIVYKNGTQLTSLECAPSSVNFGWTSAISDIKRSYGLEYNSVVGRWTQGGN